MSDRLLEGKWILVTGANRGIGHATCRVLAGNGANIWASARTHDDAFLGELAKLETDQGVQCRPVQIDVTDGSSVKSAFAQVKSSNSPLWGLVNNAGVTFNGLLQMTSIETAEAVLGANLTGVMRVMQAAVRLMQRQRSGAVVNVSSTAAIDANSGRAIYGASKAGVSVLTTAAAREWAPYGIRVNAVAPGVTDTTMLGSMSQEILAEVEASTDLGRRGQPEEIAEAICFLLSPLSSYISGQVLRVDGGMWT